MHQRKYVLELISQVCPEAATPLEAIQIRKLTRPDITFRDQTLNQFLPISQSITKGGQICKESAGQSFLLSTMWSLPSMMLTGQHTLIPWNLYRGSWLNLETHWYLGSLRNKVPYPKVLLASTMAELVWIIGLIRDIKVETDLLVNIFKDSQAATQIATNLVFHERTEHIWIDYNFIKEKNPTSTDKNYVSMCLSKVNV